MDRLRRYHGETPVLWRTISSNGNAHSSELLEGGEIANLQSSEGSPATTETWQKERLSHMEVDLVVDLRNRESSTTLPDDYVTVSNCMKLKLDDGNRVLSNSINITGGYSLPCRNVAHLTKESLSFDIWKDCYTEIYTYIHTYNRWNGHSGQLYFYFMYLSQLD